MHIPSEIFVCAVTGPKQWCFVARDRIAGVASGPAGILTQIARLVTSQVTQVRSLNERGAVFR